MGPAMVAVAAMVSGIPVNVVHRAAPATMMPADMPEMAADMATMVPVVPMAVMVAVMMAIKNMMARMSDDDAVGIGGGRRAEPTDSKDDAQGAGRDDE